MLLKTSEGLIRIKKEVEDKDFKESLVIAGIVEES